MTCHEAPLAHDAEEGRGLRPGRLGRLGRLGSSVPLVPLQSPAVV